MNSLTFKAYTDTGTLLDTVVILGNFPYGSQFVRVPLGYSSQITLSGKTFTKWAGSYTFKAQLKIQDLSRANKTALENLLVSTLKYQVNKFTLTPSPLVNVGFGEGVEVTDLKLSVNSTDKMFKDYAPSLWSIELPYQKVVIL